MNKLITFLTTALFVFGMSAQTIQLNDGWQFSQKGKDTWYDAEVPGSVQRDLIRHGVLPDPYYGTNENDVQWPELEDWDFRKTFTLTPEQLQHDDAILFFEGIDTHADVFLNGARILQSENMFVGHRVPVKNSLREGENRLYIRFYSPITRLDPARITAGYEYPADNDHSDERMSVYNRKAPYQFGWDWGIRLVQMGLWKPVSLHLYDKARIDDLYIKQNEISEDIAKIDAEIELYSVTSVSSEKTITLSYGLKDAEPVSVSVNAILQPGKNSIKIPIEIINPKLWMPINWGKQHLYDFTATVLDSDGTIAEETQRTGLRTVRLVQEPDEHGRSFYFEVNGKPIFAKGANYIPGEIMRSQQDDAYYKRMFDNMEDANFNFVRVWGGGTYEDNTFYEEADERGILVWQDFIFGCTVYPTDDQFLANVKEEAEWNIKRLRNHASLAFWCGNNEVEEGLKYWGWEGRANDQERQIWVEGYDKLFRKLLPDAVAEFDGTRSYIHGSPYDSNWGNVDKFKVSDVHDWGLWHGRMPFEAMADRLPRFGSEFGFQSFPEMKTIRTFAKDDDFDINSDVMEIHQKSPIGNTIIKQYMDMYYHTPKTFEDFVYVGLIMQGNGMEEAVEANRRGRPYCMGALYWQINDDWPVVSWSSIDYYNNWKSQHYKMRNVFAPLALGVEFRDNKLSYFAMSDYLNDVNNLTLNVQVIDFNGKVIRNFKEKVSAKSNTSEVVKVYDVADLVTEEQKHNTIVHAWLSDNRGKEISTRDYFFYWPNKLNLPETTINQSVKYADGKYTVTLSSKKLAKDVFLEIPTLGARFSDNFFTLYPGQKKVVEITHEDLKAKDKTNITVRHLRETY